METAWFQEVERADSLGYLRIMETNSALLTYIQEMRIIYKNVSAESVCSWNLGGCIVAQRKSECDQQPPAGPGGGVEAAPLGAG